MPAKKTDQVDEKEWAEMSPTERYAHLRRCTLEEARIQMAECERQMEECAKLAQEIEQLQCLEASLEAPLETKH
jgi:hypothetical protein